jgi:hypothetical protein
MKLPPVSWMSLEGALGQAKSGDKPVIVVFAIEKLKSPCTFNRAGTPKQVAELRKSLAESGALAVRLNPPKMPKLAAGAGVEEVKAARKLYSQRQKEYAATAKKYGAHMYPTMVFLAPDGGIVGRLFGPDAHTLNRALKALPAAVKAYQSKTAKESAEKADSGKGKAPNAS